MLFDGEILGYVMYVWLFFFFVFIIKFVGIRYMFINCLMKLCNDEFVDKKNYNL